MVLAAFLSLAYAPWMAGYTEMVETKNPALVGTGLALWGWILRLVVGISFIFLPVVITSVSPVVDNQPVATQTIPGTPYSAQTFQAAHPASVAFAVAHPAFLGVLSEPANAPAVAALAASPTAANLAKVGALIGPKNTALLLKYNTQLTKLVVPYQKELATCRPTRPPSPTFRTVWPSRPSSGSTGSGCAWRAWCSSSRPSGSTGAGGARSGPARTRAEHEEDVARELKELVGAERLSRRPVPSGRCHTGDLPWTPWTAPTSRPGFAVVDVETTGFVPEEERIVEVGVVVLDRAGREAGSFCTLVDPGRDPGPTHIHGITCVHGVRRPDLRRHPAVPGRPTVRSGGGGPQRGPVRPGLPAGGVPPERG